MKNKIVLLPVRFNLMHRAHERCLQEIASQKPRAIYIFLGRANAFRIHTDPFDDTERRLMIESSLRAFGIHNIPIYIFPIYNTLLGEMEWTKLNMIKWYESCEKILTNKGLPKWDLVVSLNHYTEKFEGILPFVNPLTFIKKEEQLEIKPHTRLSATHVREALFKKDKEWEKWVNPHIQDIVLFSLAKFPLSYGPLEGLHHIVRLDCNQLGINETMEARLIDGQFKDIVVKNIIKKCLNKLGHKDDVFVDQSKPYHINIYPKDILIKLVNVIKVKENLIYQFA